MSGIGEIFALAATGLAINSRDPKPEIKNRNNKSKPESTNTTDIYTTNNSRKTRDRLESLGRQRFRDSRRYKDTKVIPKDYQDYEDWLKRNQNKRVRSTDFNQEAEFGTNRRRRHSTGSMYEPFRSDDKTNAHSIDSEFSDVESFASSVSSRSTVGSDDGYHGINTNKPDSVLDRMSSITNNKKFESCVAKKSKTPRNKYGESDTWTTQFEQMAFDNPGEAVTSNAVPNSSGRNGMMRKIELERQMELDGGYSAYDATDDGVYGVVRPDSAEFIHNNMQPFVSKAPNARHEAAMNDVKQQRLELFTGSADQIDYRPKVERAPLFSPLVGVKNLYGDPVRTDEYKSRYFAGNEKRNELPFSQVKITPGLNIGYNAVGKQGYHDMYRVVPRGVDELRTLNDPKISYGSYVAPAGKGEKGPVLGRVAHYKPQTFKERDTKDMVRQAAYYTAPTVYGTYDKANLATVNRGTKETMKIGPAQHDVDGNTPGKFRGNWAEAKRENYKNDAPRNVHHVEHFAGQGHNNTSFVPDQTRRNYADKYDNPRNVYGYEEAKGQGHNNAAFLPDQTKRGIINVYDRAGHVSGEKEQIQAINWNDVGDLTKRNQFDTFDRAGHVTGERESYRAIDFADVQDATKRQVHNSPGRAGLAVSGERENYVWVDYSDISDPTKRDIKNTWDRAGLGVSGERQEYLAVNEDDVMDVTKRDVHNDWKRDGAGAAIVGSKQSIHTVDWSDLPDITKRNIFEHYDRAGTGISGEKQQIVAINWDSVNDVTKRDLFNTYDRAGSGISGERNPYLAISYDDVPNSTKRQVHDSFGRAGVSVTGERLGYTAVDYDGSVPDATNRSIHHGERLLNVTGNKFGYRAVSFEDIPENTKREVNNGPVPLNITGERAGYNAVSWEGQTPDTTKREVNNGAVPFNVTGNRNNYKAIDWDSAVPDTTNREIHPGGRAGPAYSDNRRQDSRHHYMVMKTNAGKEALEEGRAPTKVGMDKSWSIRDTNFRMKDLAQPKWRANPGSDTMYTNDQLRSMNTRIPTGRVIYNDRILAFTAENLEGNQEVNNLLHRSINFSDY